MPTPTKGPRLGGSPAHERLMLANLATSLFEHDRITTTEAKAKRLRPLAERLITFAKRGDLHARRQVMTRDPRQGRRAQAVRRDRPEVRRAGPGGYTRIIKIGPRKGDNAPMAVIELVEALTVPAGRRARPSGPAARSRRRARRRPAARARSPRSRGRVRHRGRGRAAAQADGPLDAVEADEAALEAGEDDAAVWPDSARPTATPRKPSRDARGRRRVPRPAQDVPRSPRTSEYGPPQSSHRRGRDPLAAGPARPRLRRHRLLRLGHPAGSAHRSGRLTTGAGHRPARPVRPAHRGRAHRRRRARHRPGRPRRCARRPRWAGRLARLRAPPGRGLAARRPGARRVAHGPARIRRPVLRPVAALRVPHQRRPAAAPPLRRVDARPPRPLDVAAMAAAAAGRCSASTTSRRSAAAGGRDDDPHPAAPSTWRARTARSCARCRPTRSATRWCARWSARCSRSARAAGLGLAGRLLTLDARGRRGGGAGARPDARRGGVSAGRRTGGAPVQTRARRDQAGRDESAPATVEREIVAVAPVEDGRPFAVPGRGTEMPAALDHGGRHLQGPAVGVRDALRQVGVVAAGHDGTAGRTTNRVDVQRRRKERRDFRDGGRRRRRCDECDPGRPGPVVGRRRGDVMQPQNRAEGVGDDVVALLRQVGQHRSQRGQPDVEGRPIDVGEVGSPHVASGVAQVRAEPVLPVTRARAGREPGTSRQRHGVGTGRRGTGGA